jgi:hypothetical protein
MRTYLVQLSNVLGQSTILHSPTLCSEVSSSLSALSGRSETLSKIASEKRYTPAYIEPMVKVVLPLLESSG